MYPDGKRPFVGRFFLGPIRSPHKKGFKHQLGKTSTCGDIGGEYKIWRMEGSVVFGARCTLYENDENLVLGRTLRKARMPDYFKPK